MYVKLCVLSCPNNKAREQSTQFFLNLRSTQLFYAQFLISTTRDDLLSSEITTELLKELNHFSVITKTWLSRVLTSELQVVTVSVRRYHDQKSDLEQP